ncbi:hypothetical protein CEXT_291121 [Caerostris extrusa]|uniref:Uncharacterized protein n=1 Tax=Caerostris extrusa TaxID=172846 RepID=A0AAV4NV01_CAEEX|nr:hypothetical protein CEXT_291121 [Caerostris extrusa]
MSRWCTSVIHYKDFMEIFMIYLGFKTGLRLPPVSILIECFVWYKKEVEVSDWCLGKKETVPVCGAGGSSGKLLPPLEKGGATGTHSIVRAWQRPLTSNGLVAAVGAWKRTLSLVPK